MPARSIYSRSTAAGCVRRLVLGALLHAIPAIGHAQEAKYPDWKGQWTRFVLPGLGGQPAFDQTKPWGLGQQAPLTPEYQAILEASLADQAAGGQGNFLSASCLAQGMPLMMTAFEPLEYIITAETTYVLINNNDHNRRIYTDGRDWPDRMERSFQGYSIGKWIDAQATGRYDVLDVETRGFKGPRTFDASGLPLHRDNESIVKERIYLDRADPNVLHDEITVIDAALTRPWTVDKRYRRNPTPRPVWREHVCAENNPHVRIGNENYFLSADGLLMPARKDQAPPDLRYFNQRK
jgi:hypothetical protein